MKHGLCTTITIAATTQDEGLMMPIYNKISEFQNASITRKGIYVTEGKVSVFVTLVNDEFLGGNFSRLSCMYNDLASKCKGPCDYFIAI